MKKEKKILSQEGLRVLIERQRAFLRKFDVRFENENVREERENSQEIFLSATG